MSEATLSTASRVEELQNFPFTSFQDFRKSHIQGVITVGVDRGIALQWANSSFHTPTFTRIKTLLLSFLPWLAALGFVIFVFTKVSWLWLLAVPVFVIAFFLLHPSMARLSGLISYSFKALTIIGFVWAMAADEPGLLAFTFAIMVIWFSQKAVYQTAVNGLIRAALEHEDLLCRLWEINGVNVAFYNGDVFWPKWRTQNGQTTYY